MSLNDRDAAVYELIRQRAGEGYTPSIREICRELGIKSTSTVHRILGKLQDEGLIERLGENLNRSFRLAGDGSNIRVPLVGTVTAGQPITAIQEIAGYISFKAPKHYDGELFALRVRGDSMINAAILDGDTVIVMRTPHAENGDIVVALVEGSDATVKRFYKENGHFRLQPENDAMEPIILSSVEIIGRVVAVLRYI